MAEHNSPDNERDERVQPLDKLEELEEKDSLIVDEPFIHWQRRRATKQAEEAKRWAEENPEWDEISKEMRQKNDD